MAHRAATKPSPLLGWNANDEAPAERRGEKAAKEWHSEPCAHLSNDTKASGGRTGTGQSRLALLRTFFDFIYLFSCMYIQIQGG